MSRTDFENHLEDYDYDTYLRDFDKVIDANSASYLVKKQLFQERVAEIIAHNKDTTQSWKMGVNKFTDMPDSERRAFLGYVKGANKGLAPVAASLPTGPIPTSVDWRDKGIVTPVKNQGGCGSCWAFSAAEAIESHVALSTGKLLTLSPQNLVSCTKNPKHCGGSGGCGGATEALAFDYVHGAGGIASEKDYPYRASDTPCNEGIRKSASIEGFVALPENNYTALVTAVGLVGPVSVGVDAQFFSYSSGVYSGCDRKATVDINHAVLAVGYGTDAATGVDYWIIRNSWGASWGEKGYIRLLKHSDGDKKWCKQDPTPEHGSACDGGPPEITACGSCGIWYENTYPTGAKVIQ